MVLTRKVHIELTLTGYLIPAIHIKAYDSSIMYLIDAIIMQLLLLPSPWKIIQNLKALHLESCVGSLRVTAIIANYYYSIIQTVNGVMKLIYLNI